MEKVVKTDEERKRQLTPAQYQVTRHAGTEPAFTGKYWNNHEHGIYRCVCCGNALFASIESSNRDKAGPASISPSPRKT